MIAVLLAIPLLVLDLTTSDGGLVASGISSQWEWGRVTDGPTGPARAWGTRLDDVYRHNDTSFLEVPLPDRSDAERPVLQLDHWFAVADGDGAVVEVEVDDAFVEVAPAYGYPAPGGFVGESVSWTSHAVDLSPFAPDARVRLTFTSDASDALDGWFVEGVTLWDGDPVPPRITPVAEPVDTQDVAGPYPVRVAVEDDLQVDAVTLFWDAGGSPVAVPMTDDGDGVFDASIPGQEPATTVTWWVEATDGENVARWPDPLDARFRVFLAAPGAPERTDTGRAAQQVDLAWSAPTSPHRVLDYTVWQLGGTTGTAAGGTTATVPLDPGLPAAVFVTANYPVGESEPSAVTALDLAIPSLVEVTPAIGFPGDTLRIDVTVHGLYLLDGATDAGFDDSLTVEDLHVSDVSHASLTVRVADDAAPGPRTLWLAGPQGEGTFPDAFEVLPADEAPGIVSVRPGALVQGRSAEVVFTASAPFAGSVTIDPGPDIEVTGRPRTDGTRVTVELTPNTRAPLGATSVVLDDGLRLWGAEVTVEEYVSPPQTTCGHAGAASWGWLVLVVVGLRRREHVGEGAPHV